MKSILFLVPIALFACTKAPAYTTEAIKITPSKILLQPVPAPVLQIEKGQPVTNQDLLFYTLNLEQSLILCNAKLNALQKSME